MKIFLDSVGCRLNQSEIEQIAAQFQAEGHSITGDVKEADIVIINTCAVTAKASADSRKMIRSAARQSAAKIYATGCLAAVNPEIAAALPAVSNVFSNEQKDLIPELILGRAVEIPREFIRSPLPGDQFRTRAFIKVQDGCDNHCTFCLTRIARGKSRSISKKDVLRDVEQAVRSGVKEIVLTGVNLGAWGRDFAQSENLANLMNFLLEETDIPRIRLSSLEPWDLDEEFFSLWADQRVCPHLHLSLQSGSDKILKKMARKTDKASYYDLVKSVRAVRQDIAITTDVIVGFPGETEPDFRETLDFINQIEFADGHVFRYSPRAGTAASEFPNQVPERIRKERSKTARDAFRLTGLNYLNQFTGKLVKVLWESAIEEANGKWKLRGLTDNYIRVQMISDKNDWNTIQQAKLIKIDEKISTVQRI